MSDLGLLSQGDFLATIDDFELLDFCKVSGGQQQACIDYVPTRLLTRRGLIPTPGRELDTLELLVDIDQGRLTNSDGLLRAVISTDNNLISYFLNRVEFIGQNVLLSSIILIANSFVSELSVIRSILEECSRNNIEITHILSAVMTFATLEGREDIVDYLKSKNVALMSVSLFFETISSLESLDLFKYVLENKHRLSASCDLNVLIDTSIKRGLTRVINFSIMVAEIASSIGHIPSENIVNELFDRNHPEILDIMIKPCNFDKILYRGYALSDQLLNRYASYLGIAGRIYPRLEKIISLYVNIDAPPLTYLERAREIVSAMLLSADASTSRLGRYTTGLENDARSRKRVRDNVQNYPVYIILLAAFNNLNVMKKLISSSRKGICIRYLRAAFKICPELAHAVSIGDLKST